MIDFDYLFIQPTTITEATDAYETYSAEGKKVIYFGGGTEFISRSRHGEIAADVVIDVKKIPECGAYTVAQEELIIGAGVSLNTVADGGLFPLLSDVIRRIATRTARNKITIGGNLCSALPYKEACLPFLLADSRLVVATKTGLVERPITQLFPLRNDEFLVQIKTAKEMVNIPYSHEKRTSQSTINYPVVTMAAMVVDGQVRVALSGVYEEPIRLEKLEALLNGEGESAEELTKSLVFDRILDDALATKGYREFVCETMFQQLWTERKTS